MRRAHATPATDDFFSTEEPKPRAARGAVTNEEKPIPADIEDPWSGEAASKPSTAGTLDDFLGRVVTSFLALDPDAEFEDIQRGLRLSVPGSRADRGTVQDALEEMEDLGRRAHALYSAAEASCAQSEVDRRMLHASLWARATAGAKKIKDKPTKEDIQSWMDSCLTEDVRALEVGKAASEAAVGHLKQLAVLCRDRADTLRTILRSMP